MFARRLITMLLMLAFVIPVAAGEEMAYTYVIQYKQVDAYGQPVLNEQGEQAVGEAIEGMDFIVQYADDAEMHLWLMMLTDFPLDSVRIILRTFEVGSPVDKYVYFDPTTNSEWVNLLNSEAMPPALSLQGEDGYLAGKQITLSQNPVHDVTQTDDPSDPGENNPPIIDDDPTPAPAQTMPPTESDYGWIFNDQIVLYDWPLSNQITVLPANAVVHFNEALPNSMVWDSDNKLWCLITLEDGSTAGYVRVDTIQFMTGLEAANYEDSKKPPQEMPYYETTLARITAPGAGLYAAPGGALIESIGQNDVVTFLTDVSSPTVYDNNKKLWLFVQTPDGQRGYIQLDSVSFMTLADKKEYEESLKPQQQEMPQHQSNYAYVSNAGAALCYAPDGNYIASLPSDSVVTYLPSSALPTQHDSKGKLWLYVETPDGQKGYILADDISFMTSSQAQAHEESLKPAQELIAHESNYAYVKSNSVPVVDPSTGQTLATVNATDVVNFLSSSAGSQYVDSEKRLWLRVELEDGVTGFIKMDNITFMTVTQEENYKKSKTPATDTGAEPTKETTITEAPTQTPTEKPTLAPDTSRYAYVLDNNVNVREQPNGTSKTRLNAGVVLLVTRELKDSAGVPWYEVELSNGVTGFVRADMLRLMTIPEEQSYLSSLITPSPKPTITPSPSPPLQQVKGYMRANVQNAPVLTWYNVGAQPKAALSYGSVVYVQEQVYDDNQTLWSYAQYSSSEWGYIPSAYLTPMTLADLEKYFATQAPTPTVAPTSPATTFSGYALLTSNNVNFRKTASTTGVVLAKLTQGVIVRVVAQTDADGYTWYRCESGGTTGYLRNDMVSLLSISQYQTLVTNPSYTNQSGTVITPTATANTGSSLGSTTWATQQPGVSSTLTFVTIPPVSTVDPSSLDPSASPGSSVDPSASASPDATQESTDGALIVDVTPSPALDESLDPYATPVFEETESTGFSPSGLLVAMGALLTLSAGGFYGYSVYNKARRKQAQEQAQRLAAEARKKAEIEGTGSRPAVRRPTPAGAAGAAGAVAAGVAAKQGGPNQPGDRPGAPGQTPGRPGTPGQGAARPGAQGQAPRPGAPGQGGANPAIPGRPGAPMGAPGAAQQRPVGAVVPVAGQRPNPYARPQTPQQGPRVQDVASTLPRSQVDGKPADGRASVNSPISPSLNPYARPTRAARPNAGAPGGSTAGTAQPQGAPNKNRAGDGNPYDLDKKIPVGERQEPSSDFAPRIATGDMLPDFEDASEYTAYDAAAPLKREGAPSQKAPPASSNERPVMPVNPYAPRLNDQRPQAPIAPSPVIPDSEQAGAATRRRRRRPEMADNMDDPTQE